MPVSDSSDLRRNDPRCPPASKPEATITSTPAFSSATASPAVVAVPIVTIPRPALVHYPFGRDAEDEAEDRDSRVENDPGLLLERNL